MTDNRVLVKAPFGTSERTVQEFLLSKKDKWLKDNGGVYMKRASCYNEKKQEE